MILIQDALKAQQHLRSEAKMGEEHFPPEAFVGMISDEIEALRKNGKSDEDIVTMIRESSGIEIDAATLAEHYATPEERNHGQHG